MTESSPHDDPPPLAGIRVLDFTRLLPGPACTQLLAEFGAEVLKVEDAGRADGGDFLRMPPEATNAQRSATFAQGRLFEAINRGKGSIALNLKHPQGRSIALALAARSQVVVEGFRPGVMHRLGLGYESLRVDNPSMIYCSISGYGQTGSWAQRAGHDINYLSVTGVLDGLRQGNGQPALSSVQWADLASGALNATIAILAALLGARATGRGRHLDIAMAQGLYGLQVSASAGLHGQSFHPASVPAHAPGWPAEPDRTDAAAPGTSMLTGGVAAYQVYATLDQRWLAVGALEPHFWSGFCAVIEREDLLGAGLAAGVAGRRAIAEVAQVIGSRTLAEWVETFDGHDCCVTPVLSLSEAARYGPYPRLREGMFPISLGRVELAAAPARGADGLRILSELGYSSEQIESWVGDRVIGLPPSASPTSPLSPNQP
jgi:crotonobetainyl-CoA:carnitine CoA-transferase CaiB-like acyl-CoA transferase